MFATWMRVLVFDLETDRLLCKTRDDHRELRITVGQFCEIHETGARWTEVVSPSDFGGPDVSRMFDEADRIVAYNGRGFDLEVMRGYFSDAKVDGWCRKLRDPFEAIRDATGSWVKLEELLTANALPFEKSGDGVSAVEWWASGERRRVADYCRGDVEALVALISLERIAFPIKAWRKSAQIVTGWAELDWRPYLHGSRKLGNPPPTDEESHDGTQGRPASAASAARAAARATTCG